MTGFAFPTAPNVVVLDATSIVQGLPGGGPLLAAGSDGRLYRTTAATPGPAPSPQPTPSPGPGPIPVPTGSPIG